MGIIVIEKIMIFSDIFMIKAHVEKFLKILKAHKIIQVINTILQKITRF